MSCLCGDTHCWSCGPAQGNYHCSSCDEWMDDHGEHEVAAVGQCAEGVLTFIKSLASGVTPFDYHAIRTKARDLLVEMRDVMRQEGCAHDDDRCQEQAKADAEAEANDWLWEKEHEDEIRAAVHGDARPTPQQIYDLHESECITCCVDQRCMRGQELYARARRDR